MLLFNFLSFLVIPKFKIHDPNMRAWGCSACFVISIKIWLTAVEYLCPSIFLFDNSDPKKHFSMTLENTPEKISKI